jgi:hypothetical protein
LNVTLKIKPMNTLIVHPTDPSTDFLSPIRDAVAMKTVIRNGLGKSSIAGQASQHDSFIAMGHGTPLGLLSVGQFTGNDAHIVDSSFAEMLRAKSKNIFIWCYAYQFAKKHQIPSFSTDMFISELREAKSMGIRNATQSQVEESNACFVREISKTIHLPIEGIYQSLINSEYASLSKTNPVARYNYCRFHLIKSLECA